MRLSSAVSFCIAASVAGILAGQDKGAPGSRQPAAPLVTRMPGELPAKVIDRFQVPITAKFALPLERAFQEIFGAVDVKCFVDGAALKSSGITRNEVKKLSLDQKPVYEVIQAILSRKDRVQTYPDVVLIIDEEKKLVTVTTKAEAQAKKLTPLDFDTLRTK